MSTPQRTKFVCEAPAEWPASYSDADRKNVLRIIDWINAGQEHEPGYENQRTQLKLAKWAKVSTGTLNAILRGRYPSPPDKWIRKLIEVIERDDLRAECDVSLDDYVETSVYAVVQAACHRAHVYRNISVVAAAVGLGKTTAVKHYAATHENVFLVEATPDMNASVLVNELVQQTKAIVHKSNKYSAGTRAEKTAAVIRALAGTDSLVILDEAETVTAHTLEYVRRISDKAKVGLVLSGTLRLKPLVQDPEGRFGQISSRVGFWSPVITSITEDDATTLALSLLSDFEPQLTPEVLKAFYEMCDGSARVLCNALIPGARDYGLKKGHTLTPELIYKIGADLLGFKRPAKRSAA